MIAWWWVAAASAQVGPQAHQLECSGVVGGVPGTISGRRTYTPYNALGDGTVRFAGTVRFGGREAAIRWEDSTNLPPYEGVADLPEGPYAFGVLDNLPGNQMVLYDARPTMGPPTVVGELLCRWTPLAP